MGYPDRDPVPKTRRSGSHPTWWWGSPPRTRATSVPAETPDQMVLTQACPSAGSGSVRSRIAGRPGAVTPRERIRRSPTDGLGQTDRRPRAHGLRDPPGEPVGAQGLRVRRPQVRLPPADGLDELPVALQDRVDLRSHRPLAVPVHDQEVLLGELEGQTGGEDLDGDP